MLLSNCARKNLRFIKEQGASGLLVTLLGSIKRFHQKVLLFFKVDIFMPGMHLRHPRFTYSPCGSFTKYKERIQKFKETGDSQYIYREF